MGVSRFSAGLVPVSGTDRPRKHLHTNGAGLGHPQPVGIEIPADVDTVPVEGRDLVHGWGGGPFELLLPDR